MNIRVQPPPVDAEELLARAHAVAGQTLQWLARELGTPVPADFQHDKGWAGQLLEACLGASAGSSPEPDFPALSVELKTLPIDDHGKPLESTYVCQVPLLGYNEHWQDSLVYRKLARVLWVPLIQSPGAAPGERRIGSPLLWQPDADEFAVLQQDWEELMAFVSAGEIAELSAHHGQYLQIRPKAANARALTSGRDADGRISPTLPRGWYLRSRFTAQLLQKHYYPHSHDD